MSYAYYWECDYCTRGFSSERAKEQHEDAVHSFECDYCTRQFNSERAKEQHQKAVHAAYSCECDYCDRQFSSDQAKEQHTEAVHGFLCGECGKLFASANSLDQHLNSHVHAPRNIACCFRCNATFAQPSALAHHVESQACVKVTHHQIRSAVKLAETRFGHRGAFTSGGQQARTLGWNGEYENSSESDDDDYATFTADAGTWNGSGYECCLCRREFRLLPHLNQHLQSPAHFSAQRYSCPQCKCKFKVLSALVQHLESENCTAISFKHLTSLTTNSVTQLTHLLR